MSASFQRLGALIRKEITQLLRDRRTLAMIVSLPVILLFLFAYAVSLTVDHLPLAVADQSRSEQSRQFVDALVQSGYFDQTLLASNEQDLILAIDAGIVKAGVLIPPDFTEQVQRGQGHVVILLDGSDSFGVQAGYNAASSVSQRFAYTLTSQTIGGNAGASQELPVVTSSRVLYNPDMDDLIFILPGLVAMVVQNIIVAHASMAVVRERELGISEQLLATPARPAEMIIAKLAPGTLIAVVDMAIVLSLGIFWFRIPFNGSLPLFALLSFLFIVAYMGLGLLISTVCKSQRQAQQISVLLMLVAVLLTGFIFPRTTMPAWTRAIGDLIPLTYFVRIARGIITKGVGLEVLWDDALILLLYTVVTLALASLLTKKRLD